MVEIELIKGASVVPEPDGILDSKEFLRAIVQATPECIKIVAPDGRLVQMNEAGLRMIEAPSWEAVAAVSAYDLIAPEHRSVWRGHHDRVCKGEALAWEFEIIGLNGTRRLLETHAVPIALGDGTTGQLAIAQDVSDRKIAERALRRANEALKEKVRQRTGELADTHERLRESQRILSLLVESVTDYAIYMLDLDGRVVSWNSGAQRIKGYCAEEIVGQKFFCFYTPEDQKAGLPQTGLGIAAREGRFEAEGLRVRKDGSRFLANVVIDAIYEHGELIGFAKITRDVTEKKKAEDQLRHAQRMEAIGRFTGGAAHDFNNLLIAVIGNLDLLRKRIPNDPRLLSLLDNAMQGASRGAQLTQRMLAFARRQELKLEAVDLERLVVGMRELLETVVGQTVNVETQMPRRLRPVHSDASQLAASILNLVINARDAMPGGGTVTIAAKEASIAPNSLGDLPAGDYTCLTVGDTGCGMDAATLARVREPFFTTKGVGKGTGLGLSTVDGFLAQSGGQLRLFSTPDKGTTAELWLPMARDRASTSDASPGDAARALSTSTGLVILVVDDDDLVLMSTTAMLEDLGHRVIEASSPAKALGLIESNVDIDLVISDQGMPGMTGLELIAAIKERRPELPVMLATGYAELPAQAGFPAPKLPKPFTQKDLIEAIKRIEFKRRNPAR